MTSLEDIVDAAHAKDPRDRLRAIQEAGDFVAESGASIDSAPLLVDALQPALRDNNPKVWFMARALRLPRTHTPVVLSYATPLQFTKMFSATVLA